MTYSTVLQTSPCIVQAHSNCISDQIVYNWAWSAQKPFYMQTMLALSVCILAFEHLQSGQLYVPVGSRCKSLVLQCSWTPSLLQQWT